MRLHQKSRTVKVEDEVKEHEAFRQVLLWLWQKFALVGKRESFVPDLVAWMLGERKGSILEPCKACANGTCSAMEEAARSAQMWKPNVNFLRAETNLCVLLLEGGASEPSAEIEAEVVKCAPEGDCMFIALAYVKLVCVDGKEWPEQADTRKQLGAVCRSWYLKYLDYLLSKDEPFVEGLTVSQLLLTSSSCSTMEEYKTMMLTPTLDSRTWGGWAETILLARKWNV